MNIFLRLLCCILLLPCLAQAASPTIVASTGWTAALAKAAGAKDVRVIAPETLQHPPDYDPKPSDLLKLAQADFVLLAGFEGFAQRLRDAAGGKSEVVKVELNNSPEIIRQEVTRLGKLFGTQKEAENFLKTFDKEYACLSDKVRQHLSAHGKRAVAQTFMKMWADFAGLTLVGEYGPGPLQPGELSRLTARQPDIILDNAHVPAGDPIAETSRCPLVRLRNFPPPEGSILDVFRLNAAMFMEVFQPDSD